MKCSRAVGSSGLIALCGCSLVFDASELSRGGSRVADATNGRGEGGVIGATGDGDGEAEVSLPSSPDGPDAGAGDGGPVGIDAALNGASDTGDPDAAGDVGTDAAATDALAVSDGDAGRVGPPDDGGNLGLGLVAFYPFDEASGTTAADVSGNNHTATMSGATFAPGVHGNAASMNGNGQYVTLPSGMVSGLTSFSVCAWVYVGAALAHARVFDFNSGTTNYLFLAPHGGRTATSTTQFVISSGGNVVEQRIDAPIPLASKTWQHIAVTLVGTTGTLFIDGAEVAQQTQMTTNPASLGAITQNWIGRSSWSPDPTLDGKIDNFRIYSRALSAAEIQRLFQLQQ